MNQRESHRMQYLWSVSTTHLSVVYLLEWASVCVSAHAPLYLCAFLFGGAVVIVCASVYVSVHDFL